MMRTLIIGGQEINLNALGDPLDDAFDRLHAAYMGNTPLQWEDFVSAAVQFFDNNPTLRVAHDDYFNNFTFIWRSMLAGGRYDVAERLWNCALQPAQAWEHAQPDRHVHKGTPYYFWTMTALLRGDIDRGYLLAHQAFDEDVRTSGHPVPDTPAYALVSLNYGKVEQAFRQWVQEQARFLQELIANYAGVHNSTLTLADVKRRFFDSPPSTDAVFLFTYTIARLMRISTLPDHATNNRFAGQLQLNILFDITLVIDNAIKAKNPSKQYFIDQAEHLLSTTTQPLTKAQLRGINNQFRDHFDATLRAALDGTLTIPPKTTLSRFQCDVALAYGLRNHGAHNTDTATTIWTRFPDVQQTLFRVLFTTIEHLY